jgi:hypothetical protein
MRRSLHYVLERPEIVGAYEKLEILVLLLKAVVLGLIDRKDDGNIIVHGKNPAVPFLIKVWRSSLVTRLRSTALMRLT